MEASSFSQNGFIDKTGILQSLDSSQVVNDILLKFLGLKEQTTKDGSKSKTIVIRENKPIFTEEYTKELITRYIAVLNYTVQATKFTNTQINDKMLFLLTALRSSLCTSGDANFISDKMWDRILKIHEAKGWLLINEDWEYNKPVSNRIVQYLKKYPEFNNERSNQTVVFQDIMSFTDTLIHSSLNKSIETRNAELGMLLQMLSETSRETVKEAGQQKKALMSNMFSNKEGEI